jgi:two-component system response regulator
MDGRQVLAEIKADERLKTIPVVILTTSASQDDIARAYSQHANCYITKPVDLDEFLRAVQSIETFWLSLVKLPLNH